MESPLLSTCAILLWLATLGVILLQKFLNRKRLNLPPGPKPWPIIGNLHQMGALPHRSLHQLSLKYGPLTHLQFGSIPVVVGSSPGMAQRILKNMDLTFLGRPETAAGEYTTFNYFGITWSPYGPYWRQARRICMAELFTPERLDSYEYIRTEELKAFLKRIYILIREEFLLKDYLSTFSLNVIGRMVLGKNYMEKSKRNNRVVAPEEFKKMMDELVLLNGVMNIGDYIKCVGFLDLQGYVKRMKVLSKKLDSFLEIVVDEHEDSRWKARVEDDKSSDKKVKDMMDVLLDLAEDPSLEVKLRRHGVKAFTQDLLAGGTKGSASTLEWAIAHMLKQPETFKKATEELDRVIGKNRFMTENDIPNLPYIQAILKETMRLHPVAPTLLPRVARGDCKVAGYDIQKGTIVLVSVWSIGRDPKMWDEPNEFNPDRFIERDFYVDGQDFEFLPFGSGQRMCPGYTLGMKEMEASLGSLLHAFNWRLPGNMTPKELDMEEIFGGFSTPKKIPLAVIGGPRLPLELYSLLSH